MDAQVLLAHTMNKTRAWILAHPEARPTPEQFNALENAVRRLEQGEPLPYVLGRWEFYALDFHATKEALIPRPETELLVERAISWLRENPNRRLALDVGTGSGAIAVSMAANIPDLQVVATDISLPALQLARHNATKHAVQERLHFISADLLPPVSRPFDLICANLPYIPSQALEDLVVARSEPSVALDGGPDGLALIGRLLAEVAADRVRLAPGGLLLLEIEASQGKPAGDIARRAFPAAHVQVLTDLAGRDRLLAVQGPPPN
jgi:release factor glutamine methyltransferase